MKAVATEARRLAAGVDRAHPGDWHGRAWSVCDVMGYNYMDPAGRGVSQSASREAGDRYGNGQRRGHARHLRHRSREGLCRLVRSVHHHGPRFGGRLVELLQCAAVAVGRLRVDRLRLSRRALAQRVAQHQLAVRDHRYLRLPERFVLLLPVVVDAQPVLHLFPHWNWPGMEGKEIAVWVYSNLDKVELFHQWQEPGREGHEEGLARGVDRASMRPVPSRRAASKADKVVMTAKRETTERCGQAGDEAQTGRKSSADGEDVAMFAVEVQDAQGRVVPITDNDVNFRVSGAGKLIGVGNGDPTIMNRTRAPCEKRSAGTAWRWFSRLRRREASRWRRRRRDSRRPA